uniref:Uncharacterized protein n=1 Tax=Mustela putorius furo TaxID=9669 RepID=M3Z1M3_MUSPF
MRDLWETAEHLARTGFYCLLQLALHLPTSLSCRPEQTEAILPQPTSIEGATCRTLFQALRLHQRAKETTSLPLRPDTQSWVSSSSSSTSHLRRAPTSPLTAPSSGSSASPPRAARCCPPRAPTLLPA